MQLSDFGRDLWPRFYKNVRLCQFILQEHYKTETSQIMNLLNVNKLNVLVSLTVTFILKVAMLASVATKGISFYQTNRFMIIKSNMKRDFYLDVKVQEKKESCNCKSL